MTFPRLGALLMSTAICHPAGIRYQAKHPQTRVHDIGKAGRFRRHPYALPPIWQSSGAAAGESTWTPESVRGFHLTT